MPVALQNLRSLRAMSGIMKDVLGQKYDFVLKAFPGEKSCREIILPFKSLGLKVKKGDIIIGRPMGQGCPVQHVMEIISQDKFGLFTVWMIGPQYSRNKKIRTREIGPYWVIAFEGVATNGEPKVGRRQRFLPYYCMMNLTHTGLVNFVNKTKNGFFTRLESIIIGV